MTAVRGFVIKHPFGDLDLGAIGESEADAWRLFTDSSRYTRLNAEADGYLCIELTIQEARYDER